MAHKRCKRILASILAAAMLVTSASSLVSAQGTAQAGEEQFPIWSGGELATLYLDEQKEYSQVLRAGEDLRQDIQRVTGQTPDLISSPEEGGSRVIIAGTIGNSEWVDSLIDQNKLDVTGVTGEWEAFTIRLVDQPWENVDQALVIAGSDMRGTIYGIYELSETIGVSPWYWWGDVPIQQKDELVLSKSEIETTQKPDVQYRGIFLNDEENFSTWSEQFANDTDSPGTPNANTYAKVFELLLRLKGNTLWPAMHELSDAFNAYLDPETGSSYNAEMAEEYGVVMGSSHCEMLLANNTSEWVPWCEANQGKYNLKKLNNDWKSSYDYTVNSEAMNAYWEWRVAQNYRYENVYMLGLRAVHDAGILCSALGPNATYEQKAAVVKQAVEAQTAILEKYEAKYQQETGKEVTFAKAFCPYKEAAEYYKYDLSLPEDTIIIWADDNYGYVRQLPTQTELENYGGSGIYYHVSYWGVPCSYLWMATTPLSLMYEELDKCYHAGSDTFWILNVGDLKPSEVHTEFFLRLAWDNDVVEQDTIDQYLAGVMRRDFSLSEETAAELAEILISAYQIANAKKPEFFGLNQGEEYSVIYNGDEGQRMVNQLTDLYQRSQAIYQSLPQEERDAYYERVHYTITSLKNTAEKYIYAQKSQLYATQGRFLSVNAYAQKSWDAFERILSDLEYYNNELAGGKWDGILDPYTNVNGLPKIDGEPDTAEVTSDMAVEGIGAVVEGQSTGGESVTLDLYSLSDNRKFLDVFTTGFGAMDYTIALDPCLKLLDENGEEVSTILQDGKKIYQGNVAVEQRFWIAGDWSALESTTTSASVMVTGSKGFEKSFAVSCVKSTVDPQQQQRQGYYETGGVVSLEAEHYTENVAVNGQEWRVFENLGNSGDSMKVYPDASYENQCLFSNNTSIPTAKQSAPYLAYDIYFETTGTYNGTFYRLPTLNEGNFDNGTRKSCRVLVGLDDGTGTLLRCNSVVDEGRASLWSNGVRDNMDQFGFTVTVNTPGWHTFYVLKADAGIAFDKVVLRHTDTPEEVTLLGAPESYQTITPASPYEYAATPAIVGEEVEVEQGSGEGSTLRLYDFTGSATAQNAYMAVTPGSSTSQYGWAEGSGEVTGVTRTDASKSSDRDKGFVYGTQTGIFQVRDLAPGTYSVGLSLGDRSSSGMAVENMAVWVNGTQALENIGVSAGNTMEYTFTASPDENGVLEFTFTGSPWMISSLEIWEYTPSNSDDGAGAFLPDYQNNINIEAETALENSQYAWVTDSANGNQHWVKTSGASGEALFFGPSNTAAYTNTRYADHTGPKAEYQVQFAESGSYNVWILVKLESIEDDSLLLSVDEGTASVVNDIGDTGGEYIWVKMPAINISSAGLHKISILGREDGFRLDKILITKSSSTPEGLGGKMMRQGASLDTSGLEEVLEQAAMEPQPSSELEELIAQAQALLQGQATQNEIDRLRDEIAALLTGPFPDEQAGYQILKEAMDAALSSQDSSQQQDALETVYGNLSALTPEILESDPNSALLAQYSFEGNWQNTLNPSQSATPGADGSGTVPNLAQDEEKGNVVQMYAGSVSNDAYVSVANPLQGMELKDGATISLWVKSSSWDNYGFLWSAGSKYSFVWLTGAPYFGYDGSQGYLDLNCPHNLPGASDKLGILPTSQWTLVTTTLTSREAVVYINGVEVLSSQDANYVAGQNVAYLERVINLLRTVDTLEIGSHNRHWGSTAMLADDFSIYGRALTADEVAKEYLGSFDRELVNAMVQSVQNRMEEGYYTQNSMDACGLQLEQIQAQCAQAQTEAQFVELFRQAYQAGEGLVKDSLAYDLNQDGQVNVLDVMTMAQIVVGSVEPDPAVEGKIDWNHDSAVDLLDVMYFAQLVTGRLER